MIRLLSHLRLEMVPNDFGFQIGTVEKSLKTRHQDLFWRTGFWTEDGLLVYVGRASFDEGLKWGLTHQIDPIIDAEWDFLANRFRNAGLVSSKKVTSLWHRFWGKNLTGDPFFTDGTAIVFQLEPDQSSSTVQPYQKRQSP
jgi:undecaprenyl-diphosphatase